jgi:hypothetical protein
MTNQETYDRIVAVMDGENVVVEEEEDEFLVIKSSIYTPYLEQLVKEFEPRCFFSGIIKGLIVY